MNPNCIFCRIVAGQAPASIVYEDEATLAFMDAMPVTRGHTLVIPKQHVENAYGLTAEEAAALMRTAVKIARAARSSLGCVGVNFWMANERPSGQTVMHAHMHIIPRYPGDGFGLRRWAEGVRPERDNLDDVAAAIRAHLDTDAGG
jgi:histidine triad (HIT) family protein